MKCHGCGASLRDGSRFCGRCGAAVAEPAAAGDGVLLVLPAGAPAELVEAVAESRSPAAVAHPLEVTPGEALATVQRELGEVGKSGRRIAAVCLVGDDDLVPFARLEDLCGYDDAVLTDMPYGRRRTPSTEERFGGDLLEEVPVSRIPTTDPETVHRLLSIDEGLCGDWRGGVAVSAAVWREASAEILASITAGSNSAPRLELSPPAALEQVADLVGPAAGRFYFNVHGTDQDTVWLGQGDGRYPEVLRPATVAAAPGAVVCSEACYGATLIDGDGSIAPTFLDRGAGCFLGSTIIAWGLAPGAGTGLADHVVEGFYRGLDAGLPLAAALRQAKAELLIGATGEDGVLGSPPLHNTLTSFVVYGAPLARCRRPAGASPPGGKAPRGRILDRVRQRMADAAGEDSALERVRARLRSRLTPGAWKLLSSGRAALAEAAGGFGGKGSELAARFESLLGQVPKEVHYVRFRTGGGEHTALIAGHRRSGRLALAALVVDRRGFLRQVATSR